jgi:hypothetical protein
MSTTSTTTIPVSGFRPTSRTVVLAVAALVAAFVATVVATTGLPSFGPSREAAAPAANAMPTPEWLKHYLQDEAPSATSVPTPQWLKHYLELQAPDAGQGAVPTPAVGGQRVNAGLR